LRAKVGEPAHLEDWITTITPLTAGESAFKITFDWDHKIGVPGALTIRNNHHSEFYLKSVTLEDVPGHGRILFVCNSWFTLLINTRKIAFSSPTRYLLLYAASEIARSYQK
jgi:linoleate 9S-lipoxygenase